MQNPKRCVIISLGCRLSGCIGVPFSLLCRVVVVSVRRPAFLFVYILYLNLGGLSICLNNIWIIIVIFRREDRLPLFFVWQVFRLFHFNTVILNVACVAKNPIRRCRNFIIPPNPSLLQWEKVPRNEADEVLYVQSLLFTPHPPLSWSPRRFACKTRRLLATLLSRRRRLTEKEESSR